MFRILLIIAISHVLAHGADLKIYPKVIFNEIPKPEGMPRPLLKLYVENCSDKKITIPTTRCVASGPSWNTERSLELLVSPVCGDDNFKGKYVTLPVHIYSPVTLLPGEIACIADRFFWPAGSAGKYVLTIKYFVQPDFASRYEFWTGIVVETCEVEVSQEMAGKKFEIVEPKKAQN